MAYSVAECTNKINAIMKKIADYKVARSAVDTAKSNCQTLITGLKTEIDKITGDLNKVKKNDVFEGEMANILASRVPDFKKDITSLKKKADDIIAAAEGQISKIDSKITELDGDELTWRTRLAAAAAAAVAQVTSSK